jgi:hypothetical protein
MSYPLSFGFIFAVGLDFSAYALRKMFLIAEMSLKTVLFITFSF